MIRFAGMKFQPVQPVQPVQPGQILPYDYYMGKPIFVSVRRNRFLPGICLQKPIDSN